jgi:transcriptional regulator with XRE-family HTH domain
MRGGEDNDSDARGPTVHRMMLGRLLHQLRAKAGVSSDDAAYVIRASRSKISRMENGRVSFKVRDVTDLLSRYGVTDPGMIAKVQALTRRANAPGWWARYADVTADWFAEYLGLETAASMIRTFEMQFVHGLFQTPWRATPPRRPTRSSGGWHCGCHGRTCSPRSTRRSCGRSWTRAPSAARSAAGTSCAGS